MDTLLIKRKELAAKLSLHPEQVKELTLQRKIPCVRLGRKTVLYDVGKVMAALARYEVNAEPAPEAAESPESQRK